MKKILLLFLYVILIPNVSAQTKYTEYAFVGYTNEYQENTELFKYEPVVINKFYELNETNVTYREKNFLNENEYVDIENYQEKITYLKNRQFRYLNYFVNTCSINNDIYVTKIILENFTTGNSYINEIEINKGKISYQIDGYDFLTDEKTDTGKKINGQNLIISFDIPQLLEDIEIRFHINARNQSEFSFNLIIENKENFIERKIIHKNIYSESKILLVNFMNEQDLFSFLLEKQLYNKQELEGQNVFEYSFYQINLYKHYYLEKKYILESDLNEISGLIYDPNESYEGYKIMKREIIKQRMPKNKAVKYKALGTIEIEEESIVLEKEELSENKVHKNVNKSVKKKPNYYLIIPIILIIIVNIFIFIL